MLVVRLLRVVFVVLVCLSVPFTADADPTRLVVVFSGTEIVISGMTPKGQVALVGLVREPRGYYSRLTPYSEVLDDADGDGTARFTINANQTTWKSVWGVVDLRTGDYTVATPERSPGKRVEFRGKGIGRAANGKLSRLEHEGQWMHLWLVQAGGDVFETRVVDGSALDADGQNDNVVNISLDSLQRARGKGEKPDEYRAGDVVFVADPDALTMVAARVK